MKFQSMVLFGLLCGLQVGASALAEGSAEAGQAKAEPCVACHGVNGHSINPLWPNLAGQNVAYIKRQLEAFKAGERQDPLMTPMAMTLSDEDVADVAAYYASQAPTATLETEPSKLELGARIYMGGDLERGVAACAACHSPAGNGNPGAGYALLRGQHATYVANQLKAYRTGTRKTDPGEMMRQIAMGLTDEQIEAVASYIQGLR